MGPCRRLSPRLAALIPCLTLLLLVATSPLAASVQDPVIQAIELRGLRRLNEGEVKARMKLREGAPYRPEELDEEILRLFRSNEFLIIQPPEVIPEGDGVRIVITFVEKDRIAKVRLKGFKGISRSTARDLLRTLEDGLDNPVDTRLDVQDLLKLYREKGYLFAEVTTEKAPSDGGVVVTFRANEGPRVTIGGIEFEGNDSFPDGALRRLMTTRPRSWFLGIPNSGIFDEKAYLQDLSNIRTFFRAKGYFDAMVATEDFAFNRKGNRLYVGIKIREGSRYKISRVDLEIIGKRVFPESLLRQKMSVAPGQFFDNDRIQQDLAQLARLYLDNAYIDVNTDQEAIYAAEGEEVALKYRIVEGEKVYIEDIEIRGNEETRDKVIRRELRFFPGEEMNFTKLSESRNDLFRLQYFEDVQLKFEEGSTPSQRNVIVDLKEATTGRLLFGFGVTSGRGVVGNFAINKRNFDITDLPDSFLDIPNAFTGGGQRLILEAAPGTEFSRFRIDFLEPYFLDTQTSLNLRAYRIANQREDFREDREAGEIAFGHRLLENRNLRAQLSYRYEEVNIHDIDITAPPDVFRVAGNTRLSGLRGEVRYDRRVLRPIVGPVEGFLATVGYEYLGGFLGAELDASKADAWYAHYWTLFSDGERRRHILAFKNSLAWAEPHSNTDEVPIFERYFLGGARSLRGFRFRGVGPHFNRSPVGGTARHFGTLEYTFPLIEDFFRGVGFVDYGNLAEDLGEFRGDEYRLTLGGGVLININFLGQYVPISLTWGEAVRKEDEDRARNFLFDIGFGF